MFCNKQDACKAPTRMGGGESNMWTKLSQFARSLVVKAQLVREEGQALVEYGLILGLIAVAAIAALLLLGEDVTKVFEKITTELGKVL